MAIVNSYVSLPEGMEVTTIVTPWLYNPHMTLGQASCNSQSRPIWRCPGSPEPRFRASSPGTWWSAHEGTPKLKWCSHHKTSLQDICSNIWNIPCVSRCYIWNIPTFLWECKFVTCEPMITKSLCAPHFAKKWNSDSTQKTARLSTIPQDGPPQL